MTAASPTARPCEAQGKAAVRAGQTRSASLHEAITNVAVGFVLAFLVQGLVYPPLGIVTTPQTDLLIAAIFTLVSLARSYLIRRAFDAVGRF